MILGERVVYTHGTTGYSDKAEGQYYGKVLSLLPGGRTQVAYLDTSGPSPLCVVRDVPDRWLSPRSHNPDRDDLLDMLLSEHSGDCHHD